MGFQSHPHLVLVWFGFDLTRLPHTSVGSFALFTLPLDVFTTIFVHSAVLSPPPSFLWVHLLHRTHLLVFFVAHSFARTGSTRLCGCCFLLVHLGFSFRFIIWARSFAAFSHVHSVSDFHVTFRFRYVVHLYIHFSSFFDFAASFVPGYFNVRLLRCWFAFVPVFVSLIAILCCISFDLPICCCCCCIPRLHFTVRCVTVLIYARLFLGMVFNSHFSLNIVYVVLDAFARFVVLISLNVVCVTLFPVCSGAGRLRCVARFSLRSRSIYVSFTCCSARLLNLRYVSRFVSRCSTCSFTFAVHHVVPGIHFVRWIAGGHALTWTQSHFLTFVHFSPYVRSTFRLLLLRCLFYTLIPFVTLLHSIYVVGRRPIRYVYIVAFISGCCCSLHFISWFCWFMWC